MEDERLCELAQCVKALAKKAAHSGIQRTQWKTVDTADTVEKVPGVQYLTF